jgi:hypothetical protein
MLKVARWDDEDAITNDPLRMNTTNLTEPSPFTSDIRMFVFSNQRMAGRKFMKFGMKVMP